MTDRERWLEQAELWSEVKARPVTGSMAVGSDSVPRFGICETVQASGYSDTTVDRMLADLRFYVKPEGRSICQLWWPTTEEGAQCRVWACLFMAEMCE